jgi:hypothetical protein
MLSGVNLCAVRSRAGQLSALPRDLLRRIGKSLAAEYDVRFACILCPLVAHAFDAGTNNMPAGSLRARICASCPAPLGIEMNARGACFSAARLNAS